MDRKEFPKTPKYIRLISRVTCSDAVVLMWFKDKEEGLPMKLAKGDYDLELYGVFMFSYN